MKTILHSYFKPDPPPVLKVIGVGSSASYAINRMIEFDPGGFDYIVCDTDAEVLKNSLAAVKIQLGPRLTGRLGTRCDPKIGEEAAEESYRDLHQALAGANTVLLISCLGGGTGSGASPIVARVARSIDAVVMTITTLPFTFEVGRRQVNAREGVARLRQYADTFITIPNDHLLNVVPRDLSLDLTYRVIDDILRLGVQAIAGLFTRPGLIEVDLIHLRQLIMNGGGSLLTVGSGEGENKAMKAVDQALNYPLLESLPIENATGLIAYISGGPDLTFPEVSAALEYLQSKTNNHVEIIPGINMDEKLTRQVRVILVITGMGIARPNPDIMRELLDMTRGQKTVDKPPQPFWLKDEPPAPPPGQPPRPPQNPRPGEIILDLGAFLRRRVNSKPDSKE